MAHEWIYSSDDTLVDRRDPSTPRSTVVVCRPLSVARECEQNPRRVSQLSPLWYLGMIQHDAELMHTASRLFLHLHAQVERKRMQQTEELDKLRHRQERELSALLSAADGVIPSPRRSGSVAATSDLLVVGSQHDADADSSLTSTDQPATTNTSTALRNAIVSHQITEFLFAEHEQQVSDMLASHARDYRAAQQEAAENFLSFLRVASPEHMRHSLIHRTRHTPREVLGSVPASDFAVGTDVLLVKVVNPLRGRVVGARPRDPALSSIVIELSPLHHLRQYSVLVQPASGAGSEEHQERLAAKVNDHLSRLASSRLSMTLLFGSRADVLELLSTGVDTNCSNTVELLIPVEHSLNSTCPLQWSPLHGSLLEVAFTSTMYAANIVARPRDEAMQQQSAATTTTFLSSPFAIHRSIREAVHFAISHGVTRFTTVVSAELGSQMTSWSEDRWAPRQGSEKTDAAAATTDMLSVDAAVLRHLNQLIAEIQMNATSLKPVSVSHLSVSSLLLGLAPSGSSELWTNPPPHPPSCVPGAHRTHFNTSMEFRVFLATVPLEVALLDAFGRDVEVIARTAA